MDRIAVLIPCYNESKTIEKVVRDFREALPGAAIYVYDNNSTDGTGELAEKAGAIVRREPAQGKGNVIRAMFCEIDAECYLITDGDDTYPADHAQEMVDRVLLDGCDMVVGDRLSSTYFQKNTRRFHGAGNLLVRRLVNGLFGGAIEDIMTGYRAFSFSFVKTFPVLSKGFEIETEMSIHALDRKLRLASLPVDYRDRPQGSESKLHTLRDGARVLSRILVLLQRYRPLAFFAAWALVLLVVAVVMLVPVFVEYHYTGLVPRFPTLFVGCFLALAALQCYMTGLSLETQRKKDREDFEVRRNFFAMRLREMRKKEGTR